ncbi:MAG: hypothetical protein JWN75_600 [Candidatus Saccharibacteria bacterium]|nr:hypothetical protein [Candidatus Saccharibacteria bacterium]
MNIFKRHISFTKHDPLDDGLGDEIANEQQEADAFLTLNDTSAEELNKQWSTIVKDIEKDPDWFTFTDD